MLGGALWQVGRYAEVPEHIDRAVESCHDAGATLRLAEVLAVRTIGDGARNGFTDESVTALHGVLAM
ncbi:hypothetical protein KSE_05380 [Kitasatospora setae KM-6054]|uniref:Uncharacterized protein n=1 Tax=Kitasatospora setae (strain ATCC 33774 / DSM 43861 / JCM 3304 / KCC A-0304 / NBRC 14216 / KM-6054) TaxID=452652 RepID=E4N5A3_KITSK|nr:hypothetical protein KSE_05380 [Kitasatospora setae KM-6054]